MLSSSEDKYLNTKQQIIEQPLGKRANQEEKKKILGNDK